MKKTHLPKSSVIFNSVNIAKNVFFLSAPKSKALLLPTLPLSVGSTSITPVSQCINPGVVLDSECTVKNDRRFR